MAATAPPKDSEMSQVSESFASDPAQVGAARKFIVEAAGLGSDDARAYDLRVCASEAVTNAVLHARKPGPDDPPSSLVVSVKTDRRGVTVTVTDGGGVTTPTIRRKNPDDRENGRGVALIEALADRWGFERTTTGCTRVWFEFHNGRANPDASAAATLR
ncbi:ATP-binding protein [Actinomadura violacea]|uniref:ATP-binding protein n=1 Tax=Actinomadura violacea TaxID=2819934 RepID=A0ABS3RY94_9ACTN|nr:ATP-binding protein [Actinomadura violacea]MBO2461727.1 ATP-binding protein [Actinomadura violacea]